jgi:hypothetical protein
MGMGEKKMRKIFFVMICVLTMSITGWIGCIPVSATSDSMAIGTDLYSNSTKISSNIIQPSALIDQHGCNWNQYDIHYTYTLPNGVQYDAWFADAYNHGQGIYVGLNVHDMKRWDGIPGHQPHYLMLKTYQTGIWINYYDAIYQQYGAQRLSLRSMHYCWAMTWSDSYGWHHNNYYKIIDPAFVGCYEYLYTVELAINNADTIQFVQHLSKHHHSNITYCTDQIYVATMLAWWKTEFYIDQQSNNVQYNNNEITVNSDFPAASFSPFEVFYLPNNYNRHLVTMDSQTNAQYHYWAAFDSPPHDLYVPANAADGTPFNSHPGGMEEISKGGPGEGSDYWGWTQWWFNQAS